VLVCIDILMQYLHDVRSMLHLLFYLEPEYPQIFFSEAASLHGFVEP
jgi:hypothetical protein